jgi:hypothetical protein
VFPYPDNSKEYSDKKKTFNQQPNCFKKFFHFFSFVKKYNAIIKNAGGTNTSAKRKITSISPQKVGSSVIYLVFS